MNTITVPLKPQMKSPAMGDIHQVLAVLGLKIADTEETEQRYGRSIGQVMRKLLSDHNCPRPA